MLGRVVFTRAKTSIESQYEIASIVILKQDDGRQGVTRTKEPARKDRLDSDWGKSFDFK